MSKVTGRRTARTFGAHQMKWLVERYPTPKVLDNAEVPNYKPYYSALSRPKLLGASTAGVSLHSHSCEAVSMTLAEIELSVCQPEVSEPPGRR